MKLLFSLIVTIAVISPISLFAFQLNSSSRRLSTLQRPLYAPSFPSLSSNVFHNSFSPLYSSSFTLDQSNNISKENNKQLLSKIKNTFLSIAKRKMFQHNLLLN